MLGRRPDRLRAGILVQRQNQELQDERRRTAEREERLRQALIQQRGATHLVWTTTNRRESMIGDTTGITRRQLPVRPLSPTSVADDIYAMKYRQR